MIRDPHDLQRYTASERANHWVTGICFILLALSGLALFHPALFPLTMLFGGGVWTRILHPFVGVVMMLFFVVMFFRFQSLNRMTETDWEWVKRAKEMVNGDDHNMPIMGKYNGGQKLLFWFLGVAMVVLFASGIVIWRAYFSASFPIGVVRIGATSHQLTVSVEGAKTREWASTLQSVANELRFDVSIAQSPPAITIDLPHALTMEQPQPS